MSSDVELEVELQRELERREERIVRFRAASKFLEADDAAVALMYWAKTQNGTANTAATAEAAEAADTADTAEAAATAVCGPALEAMSRAYASPPMHWATAYTFPAREVTRRTDMYQSNPPIAELLVASAATHQVEGRPHDRFRHLIAAANAHADFGTTSLSRVMLLAEIAKLALELGRFDEAMASARAMAALEPPEYAGLGRKILAEAEAKATASKSSDG